MTCLSTDGLQDQLDKCLELVVPSGDVEILKHLAPFFKMLASLENEIDEQNLELEILESAIDGNPMTRADFTKYQQTRVQRNV